MISITLRSVYKLLERESMGKIIRNDWKDYGRNGCLNDNDLDDLATKMNIKSGSTIAEDEIKNAIQEK